MIIIGRSTSAHCKNWKIREWKFVEDLLIVVCLTLKSRGLPYIHTYKENMNITGLELRVKFDGEAGVDGGGLTRELFPVFRKSVENKLCEGSSIKVPMITPEYASHFFHLGRILSHGFVLTGFLPICLASFLCHLFITRF